MSQLKTLYFVNGVPNVKQHELAKKAGAVFRNSGAYTDADFVEKCAAVMGDIPKKYEKFEKAKQHSEALKLAKPEPAEKPKAGKAKAEAETKEAEKE